MVTATQEQERVSLYPPPIPPISTSMCLEDVIRRYGGAEQKRKLGNDENDSDRKHIRSAINELASSVKVVAARLGVSQSVLTKCASRHAMCWFQEALGLDSLVEHYDTVFLESKKGHTVIRKQMQQINFKPDSEPEAVDVHWEVPNFVSIGVSAWREPMSAETYTLLVYGVAWSLTTIKHREWDEYNIETYFLPEIRHLEKMLAFRRIDLEAFQRKLEVDNDFVPKS